MLSVLAGEDATIAVPFERDGEPFVADANSVTWTLRGHNGPAIGGPTGPVATDDTYLLVTVPGSSNTVASGKQFEKRFVVVKGEVDGQPFTTQVAYLVSPWLNTTVTPDAVRAFCGADTLELPDDKIAVPAAYFRVSDLVGSNALAAALASGAEAEVVANAAIVAQAFLTALPGLRQRMLKKTSDGAMSAERFAIDFDQLAGDAQAAIRDAVRVIGGVEPDSVARNLIILTNPIDPVTGV